MEIDTLYQKYVASSSVSTDTRQITPGSMFFALKGDKFNANEFTQQALEKGAAYVVIDEAKYAVDDRCIVVDDVLTTLQKLARYHRDQLTIPVIGLTGSNGKTTTKELVNAVLSKKYKTHATKGNLNNHIGVPLTLLAIDKSVELAVVEMGANHVGEIELLCTIANPTHGFITNIGKAHIGTFGGYENIIKGKTELYQHLIKNNGKVFMNSQNTVLIPFAKQINEPVFYHAKGDFYHCDLVDSDPFVRVKAENGDIVETKLIGAYNTENIAVALCLGKYFGVDATLANEAIAEYTPGNMRSQIVNKESNTIILDAYNANPSSMKVAIDNLAAMRATKKVAILGDMFELEEQADKEHESICRLLGEKKFDAVYLCGNHFAAVKGALPSASYFTKKEDLITSLKDSPVRGATVLVKASRGIGLESVVEFL